MVITAETNFGEIEASVDLTQLEKEICYLSIVIPAKNEESRIERTIQKLKSALQLLNISFEIIVVNDGSNDLTAAVAQSAGALVISHPYNMGIAAAFRSGAKFSKGQVIMLCPADIDDFGFMKDSLYACNQYEVVSISKRHPDSEVVGYSKWRWFLSNSYQNLVELLFGAGGYCTDTHYIKFYNGTILRTIIDRCFINGPVGETEIMLCAKDAGCTFFEVPAKIFHINEHSKMSYMLIIRATYELLFLRLRRLHKQLNPKLPV
jgi:glycosyltransferase involved in cell wall biosynthesis